MTAIGMVPEMIRAAVVWGGTDRHDSRDLYGRYGYGLPSSAVSSGSPIHGVLARSTPGLARRRRSTSTRSPRASTSSTTASQVPKPAPADLPEFVAKYADKEFPGGVAALRTVVVVGEAGPADASRGPSTSRTTCSRPSGSRTGTSCGC